MFRHQVQEGIRISFGLNTFGILVDFRKVTKQIPSMERTNKIAHPDFSNKRLFNGSSFFICGHKMSLENNFTLV
jgi:hypothetical protein